MSSIYVISKVLETVQSYTPTVGYCQIFCKQLSIEKKNEALKIGYYYE